MPAIPSNARFSVSPEMRAVALAEVARRAAQLGVDVEAALADDGAFSVVSAAEDFVTAPRGPEAMAAAMMLTHRLTTLGQPPRQPRR